MRWYDYTTFDIITDLAFGELLYCLRDNHYHSWVTAIFASSKAIGLVSTRKKYPIFDYYDRFWSLFRRQVDPYQARVDFSTWRVVK